VTTRPVLDRLERGGRVVQQSPAGRVDHRAVALDQLGERLFVALAGEAGEQRAVGHVRPGRPKQPARRGKHSRGGPGHGSLLRIVDTSQDNARVGGRGRKISVTVPRAGGGRAFLAGRVVPV
jgi:hypothetical protein